MNTNLYSEYATVSKLFAVLCPLKTDSVQARSNMRSKAIVSASENCGSKRTKVLQIDVIYIYNNEHKNNNNVRNLLKTMSNKESSHLETLHFPPNIDAFQ